MSDPLSIGQLQGTEPIHSDHIYDGFRFNNVNHFRDDESQWSELTFDTAQETLPASTHLQASTSEQNKSNETVATNYERTVIDSDSIEVALSTSISMDFDILDPRHRNRDSEFDYFSSRHRLTQESLSHLQAAVSDTHVTAVDNFVLSSMHSNTRDNGSSSFDWEQTSHDLRVVCTDSDRRRSSDETKYDERTESAMVIPDRSTTMTKLSEYKKRSCSAPQRISQAFLVGQQDELASSSLHRMSYRRDFANSCPYVSSPTQTQFIAIRQPMGRHLDISEHLYSRFSADTSSDNESQSRLALARHSNRTEPRNSHELAPLYPDADQSSAQILQHAAPPTDLLPSSATRPTTLSSSGMRVETRAQTGCSCHCHSERAIHVPPELQGSNSQYSERVQKHSPALSPMAPNAVTPAIKTSDRHRSVSHENDPRLYPHHYQSELHTMDRRASVVEPWPIESFLMMKKNTKKNTKTSGKARLRPKDSVKSFRRFSSTLQLFSTSGSVDVEAARSPLAAEGPGKMRKILGRVESKVDKFLGRLSADRRRASDCPANCTTRPNRGRGCSSRGSPDGVQAARKSLERSQMTTMSKGIY